MSRSASRYAKGRVDALSDGVFAFAMTLLVLDIRLPDDLAIASAAELAAHLVSLSHQTLTYLISFFVLGAFWRGGIEVRPSAEEVTGGVVRIALLFLFFVTMVPFSSGLVGRYGDFTPAVLVYAVNMAALAACAIALRHLDVPADKRSLAAAAGGHMPLFIASALLSVLVSFVAPRYAMLAYLLNLLSHTPGWPSRSYADRG
ncbi:TMEM175 family protein [Xanthobacter sp. AM11]|uniref:TMEM175 family protein n=1 Tax=Xanthobacter sp. AM11 TaxID=3380643 RepID=UPI0039BEE847